MQREVSAIICLQGKVFLNVFPQQPQAEVVKVSLQPPARARNPVLSRGPNPKSGFKLDPHLSATDRCGSQLKTVFGCH